MTSVPLHRLNSIDILRALTMVLMIFVNDLWSLRDIPAWLEHTHADEDGMGLADVVFPAFLFIVGMSLPFAVMNRKKKGETRVEIIGHILMRSGALLIMGLFLVNGENINEEATGLPRIAWNVLSCFSFILVWNSYSPEVRKTLVRVARITGIIILAILALLYRGGEGDHVHGFATYWWGILGLIGWAYLVCGVVYVLYSKRLIAPVIAWVIFVVLCMLSNSGMIPSPLKVVLGPLGGGAMPALTIGGVIVSAFYLRFRERNTPATWLGLLTVAAAALIVLGFFFREYWIISKIRATPPWILICSGLTIMAFVAVYVIADLWGKATWFNLIKPAGTNTLLCYLLPYFAYAIPFITTIHFPEWTLVGGMGLLKSLLFALFIAQATGWLTKRGIQLKL
jgi:predicted acyltransferase